MYTSEWYNVNTKSNVCENTCQHCITFKFITTAANLILSYCRHSTII